MRRHWKFLALQGVLIIVCGNGIMFVGLQFTTAINGALINSAEPVTIVLFAWLMFRERLSIVQWLGVLVSLTGVIYLIGRGDIDALLSFNLNLGDIFVFISILCWSVYAVLMRNVPPELDRLNFLFGILVAGAVAVFPFWILENYITSRRPSPGRQWQSPVVWRCLRRSLRCCGGTVPWRDWGPRAGLLLHLIPAFTFVLAIALLGEEPRPFHAVGIVLIGAGIYLTTILKSRKADAG